MPLSGTTCARSLLRCARYVVCRAHTRETFDARAEAADPRSLQVHVNELLGGAETAAYLIKYDSVHGTWPRKVDNADDHFTVDGQKISFSDKEDFTQAPRQHTHRHGATQVRT